MAEYWLISAPGDKTMQQTWETMNNITSKQHNLCVNYKFHIPDLKVSSIRKLNICKNMLLCTNLCLLFVILTIEQYSSSLDYDHGKL